MAKIDEKILPQQFEVIRDRIAVILLDELKNQGDLGIEELDGFDKVWVDRSAPFTESELPAVNISLATGNFDNEDSRSSDGTYTYYIDVYSSAKESEDLPADELASAKVDRILGVIRAVLKHPSYIRLDFAAPSISRTTVSSFQRVSADAADAASVKIGRLQFTVRVPETVRLSPGILLGSSYTRIKLSTTDKGYVYEYNDEVVYYVTQAGKYLVNQTDNKFIQN